MNEECPEICYLGCMGIASILSIPLAVVIAISDNQYVNSEYKGHPVLLKHNKTHAEMKIGDYELVRNYLVVNDSHKDGVDTILLFQVPKDSPLREIATVEELTELEMTLLEGEE